MNAAGVYAFGVVNSKFSVAVRKNLARTLTSGIERGRRRILHFLMRKVSPPRVLVR